MENICRTCLCESADLKPLYNDPNLINKIETITSPILLFKLSDYPSNICEECITNINTFYNFRNIIINSQEKLQEQRKSLQSLPKHEKIETEVEIKQENITNSDDNFDSSDDEIDVAELRSLIKEKRKRDNECGECGEQFSTRLNLTIHKKHHHVPTRVCSVCGAVVRSDNINKHIQIHFAKPEKCELCGKVLKNRESLRGHMLLHRGLTFSCQFCDQKYKSKSEYRRHVKTHLDPDLGRATCSICGKRVRDLKKHTRSHTGERPHVCIYCKKGFTSSYARKVHERQHTNERPYMCEFCPTAFTQKVSLVTHIKSKHKGDL